MKWKVVIFLSAILLCFSVSFVIQTHASPGYYEITVTVSAGATRVPAGTPIVVKASDITAELGGATIDWNSIYMFFDSKIVPYQIDDIDVSGDVSADDEFVFQVAEDIAAGGSGDYTLWFAEVADDFQSFWWPVLAWTDYVEDYSLTDLGALGGPDAPPGPAYFLKNDMITISVPLQAEWRQGSAFNALIDATGWDVVKQGHYYSRSWAWRWSGFLYEADLGWAGPAPGTNFTLVKAILQGPVRSMLIINSTEPYKGADGEMPGVHELKTFTIYKGMPAVYSDITLTGPNAMQDYNFTYAVKMVDQAVSGGTYDTVYAPGVGEQPRWNYTLGQGVGGVLYNEELGDPPLDSWWFKMYNATSGRGYGLCFSDEDLWRVDWSADNELNLWYYDLDEPPYMAKRLLVLFDPSVTTDSTSLMEKVYDTWSADYTVALTTAAVTTETPDLEIIALQAGLEASRIQRVILQSSTSILGLTTDMLNSWISTLQETIDDQAILIDDMNNTITTLDGTITTLQSTISDQADLINDLDDTMDSLNSTLTSSISDLQTELDEAKDSASSATTYGMAGIAAGIIGIIIGAIAIIRKR